MKAKLLNTAAAAGIMATGLALVMNSGAAFAQGHEGKSADEIAKELSNPAGSLASLSNNFQYTTYKGDLPDAGNQDAWAYIFQPVLPFPVGDKGNRIIFRPAVPVPLSQPIFRSNTRSFDTVGPDLGDITFDTVYAGTKMESKGHGYLWGIGVAGTLPTATNDAIAGNQWRLGPEVFGGIIRPWGVLGGLVSNQWRIGGSNHNSYSTMTAQYFYAYGLGKGWQISSSPVITYDSKASSGNKWSVPLGVGLAKTTKIGDTPWKFQGQVQYFVQQPNAFGSEWLFKFTISPVIKNPFL